MSCFSVRGRRVSHSHGAAAVWSTLFLLQYVVVMVSATPPTPTDVTASVTGALEFTITWTAPDPIDGVIGYEVYTREASTQFFPTKHVVSGASTNYLRLSGLLKGGRYFYQVNRLYFSGGFRPLFLQSLQSFRWFLGALQVTVLDRLLRLYRR